MSTPNMGLTLPTDHGSADVWDTLLDAVFANIDAHDHSPGKGVLVPTSGLNFNADLQASSGGSHHSIYDLNAIDFFPVATSVVSAFAGALFLNAADNNLYWRTTLGSNVQLTNGAALNVSAFAGGIGGDYTVVGALESYDSATARYLLQQPGSPRPWAGLATADIDLYQKAASIVNKVTLKSPAALAASYALTLPAAVPAATAPLFVDTTGNVTAGAPANANIKLSGTGYLQRGNARRSIPIIPNGYMTSAGSVTVTGGNAAPITVTANTTAFIPIPDMEESQQLQSVDVYCVSVTGSPTCQILIATSIGFVAASAVVTLGTGVTTVAMTTPSGLTSGGSFWLKFVTTGATTANPLGISILTTVP